MGTLLLLWPCLWSTALAAPLGCLPDPVVMGQFAVGAFVMRGERRALHRTYCRLGVLIPDKMIFFMAVYTSLHETVPFYAA